MADHLTEKMTAKATYHKPASSIEDETPQASKSLGVKPKPETASVSTASGVAYSNEAYTLQRSRSLNEMWARTWATMISIPDKDNLGPFTHCVTYHWTSKTRAEYLAGGGIPADAERLRSDIGLKTVLVQIQGQSKKFPGHADDLGRTSDFLRVSYDKGPVVWIFDTINEQKGAREHEKLIAMIPNQAIDTPHRRKINEEYLKSGKSEVNQIVVKPFPVGF